MELAAQVAAEQDPKKFHALIVELNEFTFGRTAAEFPLAVGGQGGQTLLRGEDRLVQKSEITERGRIDIRPTP